MIYPVQRGLRSRASRQLRRGRRTAQPQVAAYAARINGAGKETRHFTSSERSLGSPSAPPLGGFAPLAIIARLPDRFEGGLRARSKFATSSEPAWRCADAGCAGLSEGVHAASTLDPVRP